MKILRGKVKWNKFNTHTVRIPSEVFWFCYCFFIYSNDFQVKDQLLAHDDMLMQKVIRATENLWNTTQHISNVFNKTSKHSVIDIRTRVVGNTCSVLYDAVYQTLRVMGQKACRLENQVGNCHPELGWGSQYDLVHCIAKIAEIDKK